MCGTMTTLKVLLLFCMSILGTVRGDCTVGFMGFNGYCYAVLPVKVSWSEALRLCEAFQAKLAWIDSKTEDTFIEGMLARYHDSIASSEVWIGGSDLMVEGIWLWADTLQPFTYKNFLPGQPDNGGTNQHCLGLFRDKGFKWDDYYCDSKLFPLCKAVSGVSGGQVIG